MLVVLQGCENPEYWTFKEEVVLNTGQRVLVDRKLRRNNVWPHISADGYRSIVDERLTQSTLRIEWRTDLESHARGYGRPLSIGFFKGSIYLIVGKAQSEDYCRANPAAYNVAVFKQLAVGWEEVEQSSEILSELTQNLLTALEWGESSEPKPKTLSVTEKAIRGGHPVSDVRTLKQYLDSETWTKCRTTLKPSDVSRPASSSQGS
jgi:hypothetical protein